VTAVVLVADGLGVLDELGEPAVVVVASLAEHAANSVTQSAIAKGANSPLIPFRMMIPFVSGGCRYGCNGLVR
jgi:hypothetical protein